MKGAMQFCRNLLLFSWIVADPSHRGQQLPDDVSEYNQQPNSNNCEDRGDFNILSNC